MELKRCFDPVVDERTRLLVLGSLPGDKSLAVQEYYGNRQNKFWELLGAVIDVDLRTLAYEQRLTVLRAHGIGLWDVVAEAHRQGSLDSAIRFRNENDLHGLLDRFPTIKAIAFNGGTAGKLGIKVLGARADAYEILTLPSSSPAYTLPYQDKAKLWLALQQMMRRFDGY
ncbi:G/U mismatch-specific uracil-DNA glycosylase [Duganella sp. CF458]|uniref:DNA-deoxyinosine glycosylase n=1 Tax=Duganella sp. CF458 TaxID=1884368 RepID=UPI0008E78C50|nr:DNA-deoxyinosine glycosylase [Duganella sp. CF458]SFF55864.1 G/U mismatch-specific uracil-DNA glycosylase [Duganella sp. CF458]